MSAVGKWKKQVYDTDGTAFFNQTGQRKGRRLTYKQASFLKYSGMDSTYAVAAKTFGKCCNLVFIHVLTNGNRVVQGLEIDAAASGGFTGTKVTDTMLTPNLLSDTSQNDSRMEFNVEGEAKEPAPFTTLTDTAIEAL